MARCGQCGEVLTGCQCSMADSECFTINGAGSGADPFTIEPIIDPDALNILECNPSGIGAFIPEEIRNPPTCSVYRSSSQSIAAGVRTILLFNQEMFDTDSMHDTAPPNEDKITFNTAGVYSFSAHILWEANANADRKVEIFLNNLTIIASTEDSVDQNDPFSQTVSRAAWKVNAGDYANVQVSQNSGVTLQVVLAPEFSPHFCVAYQGPG